MYIQSTEKNAIDDKNEITDKEIVSLTYVLKFMEMKTARLLGN
jgi:hypothetical protein